MGPNNYKCKAFVGEGIHASHFGSAECKVFFVGFVSQFLCYFNLVEHFDRLFMLVPLIYNFILEALDPSGFSGQGHTVQLDGLQDNAENGEFSKNHYRRHYMTPTQTIHYYKATASKLPYICVV